MLEYLCAKCGRRSGCGLELSGETQNQFCQNCMGSKNNLLCPSIFSNQRIFFGLCPICYSDAEKEEEIGRPLIVEREMARYSDDGNSEKGIICPSGNGDDDEISLY